MGFTSGQRAYSDYFELSDRKALVDQINQDAIVQGVHCRIARQQYNVCFFTCLRYNFWEDCADNPAMKITADKAADYTTADVKVLHFIAYRKLGMGVGSPSPSLLNTLLVYSTACSSSASCASCARSCIRPGALVVSGGARPAACKPGKTNRRCSQVMVSFHNRFWAHLSGLLQCQLCPG